MLEELTKKSEEISKRINKITGFSNEHGFFPYKETNKIIEELFKLTDSIPDITTPKNQNELLLSEVALNPSSPLDFIIKKIHIFDSEGNLTREAFDQIMYAAQPVERALEEFKKRGIFYDEKGRSKIDEVFLNGYWTPIGFVDNARLKARE